jgi:uncharacterized protein YecT (DUF1311 family)
LNWHFNSSLADWLLSQCVVLFTLLLIPIAQIHAQTQATMNAQARAEFEQADAELNKTYQALLTKLRNAESKQKLKEAQRAWIASRDAQAARAADEAAGGSMAPTIRDEKMTELTRQRTQELKAMLENARSDGGSASTATPSASPDSDIEAEESPTAEKIRDISPNRKFAVRILYEADVVQEDPEKIDSTTIKAIELVALPAKNKVLDLLPSDEVGTNYDHIALMWSPDSKWCAFYYNAPRVGYTSVYHQGDHKFVAVNKPEDLVAHVEGDVTNEYIRPLRWARPGVLLLEQLCLFQGGDEAEFQLTAGLDPKTGKFRILSKKKLPPDVREKEDYWP